MPNITANTQQFDLWKQELLSDAVYQLDDFATKESVYQVMHDLNNDDLRKINKSLQRRSSAIFMELAQDLIKHCIENPPSIHIALGTFSQTGSRLLGLYFSSNSYTSQSCKERVRIINTFDDTPPQKLKKEFSQILKRSIQSAQKEHIDEFLLSFHYIKTHSPDLRFYFQSTETSDRNKLELIIPIGK